MVGLAYNKQPMGAQRIGPDNIKKKKKREREKKHRLEQAHEVAGEHVPPLLPPRLVQQLATPPPVVRRRGYGNNVTGLEIKLLFNGCCVVVQGFDCTPSVT